MADQQYLPRYWRRQLQFRLVETISNVYYQPEPDVINKINNIVTNTWDHICSIYGDHYLVKRIIDLFPNMGISSQYSFHEIMELLTVSGLQLDLDEFNQLYLLKKYDKMLWVEYWIGKLFKLNASYCSTYYESLTNSQIYDHLQLVISKLPLYQSKLLMRLYYESDMKVITAKISIRLGCCAAVFWYQQTCSDMCPSITNYSTYLKQRYLLKSTPTIKIKHTTNITNNVLYSVRISTLPRNHGTNIIKICKDNHSLILDDCLSIDYELAQLYIEQYQLSIEQW